MKLRTRIALTAVLVAAPVLVTVAWLRARFMEEGASEAVGHAVTDYMQRGGRAACERAPATWQVDSGAPLPIPPEARGRGDVPMPFFPAPIGGTFAYDAGFVSANPEAPHLDAELRAQIAREPVARRRIPGDPPMIEVLFRMPWRDGPCALILVRRPAHEHDRSLQAILPVEIWAPLILIILVAVLFGVGPAVRRLRLLTREVRAAASAGYAPQVAVRGTDEIGDLASAFNEAGREIRARMEAQERRERTLREFLDNTTHDVMTPLTVLQGHLAALAEHGAPDPRLGSAMDEVHYMASLIHNLQLAAKLEAGEPDVRRERFALDALIERVVARHQPIARNHAIALDHATPGSPVIVRGDVTAVEQAISNLVINAVQHVDPGGHVAVALDRVEPGRFAIRIVDDGPGMPAEELARVIERGLRGNAARTRAPGGRGLGLDIAHRVLRLHGWSLALAATEPHGLSVAIGGPLEPG